MQQAKEIFAVMNAMLDQILQGPSPQSATDYYQIIGCDETANVSARLLNI